jgi:hypothetical protein
MTRSASLTDGDSIRLMLAYLCISTEKEASLERKVEILDRFDLDDGRVAQTQILGRFWVPRPRFVRAGLFLRLLPIRCHYTLTGSISTNPATSFA